LRLNEHEATAPGAGDRVVEQAALLLVLVRDGVRPDDDDVIDFAVLGLLYRHGDKFAVRRLGIAAARSEAAVHLIPDLVRREVPDPEDAALLSDPAARGLYTWRVAVRGEERQRLRHVQPAGTASSFQECGPLGFLAAFPGDREGAIPVFSQGSLRTSATILSAKPPLRDGVL
jgi:hypothetical protein